jgi:hypothetical protein
MNSSLPPLEVAAPQHCRDVLAIEVIGAKAQRADGVRQLPCACDYSGQRVEVRLQLVERRIGSVLE